MKKFIKIVAPISVLIISVFIVQALAASKPVPEKKEPTQRLISLYVDEVKSEEITPGIKSQGEVRPKTEINLTSRVTGHVVSISDSFAEGAEFNSETTLIKIDDTDYKVAVIRAEAKVASAEVGLERELANAKMKKDTWLQKRGDVTPSAFALNKPQVLEAEANLRAAKADLKEAKLNVTRTEIKVPFNGRVVSKLVGLGQYITAGTQLGKVFSVDSVEVRLPLTDLQLTELDLPMGYMAEPGKGPVVNFSTSMGRSQHQWQGRVIRTNASVDQQTRLIYVTAEVIDPYGKGADFGVPLAVGMFVTAEIQGVESKQVLVIPRDALRNADKVYVVDSNNKLDIRSVEVISTSEEQVLLSAGVSVGEKVAISTVPNASHGMLVQPISKDVINADLVSQL
ncbi:efflux RND transporter periplasmic adaptor subunit [Marinicella litoralis]|uniref:RND family efflux transporter MFP subunit n=1 Tax=Marinicella litoralis TaxID=644220 RepID=A0A4R6XDW2_9GAMM|nr:efflux RND transporter periplasmic adaptor subunit [Marinicella litoralis]TDR17492.1 RND family efflux transporter MFP subunit [Marinicella litoralis]